MSTHTKAKKDKKWRAPVEEHGSGYRIRWTDASGRRRSEVSDTPELLEERYFDHLKKKRRVKLGVEDEDVAPVFKTGDDLCDYWLKHRTAKKRSPKDDQSIIRRHIRPAFGKSVLRALNKEQVDEFCTALEGKQRDVNSGVELPSLSPQTVRHVKRLLKAMLKEAVNHRWMRAVPPLEVNPVAPSQVWSCLSDDEEIARFLAAALCEGADGHPNMAFMLYATAIYTGMRAGELAGLEWRSVDLGQRTIQVSKSFEKPTKNGKARTVPVLDALLPLLEKWKVQHPGRLVFTNEKGKMLCSGARLFREVFHRVLERAGFGRRSGTDNRTHWYIRFHDLRHTFASLWVTKGGTLFKLQEILGHSDPKMTMRYARLLPDAFSADYARLGAGHVQFQNAQVIAMPSRAVREARRKDRTAAAPTEPPIANGAAPEAVC